MAKKQHAWALLTTQAKALLEQSMVQETGAFVTVKSNDGELVQVPETHGGFTTIALIDGGWQFLLGCGMDWIFQAMITQLQAVGTQVGHSVGVLLAIVDDIEGTEEPDISQLDAWMPGEAKAAVDAWLSTFGYEVAPNGSYRDVIEHVGMLFRDGFAIGQDSIS